jgi:hypothetical protein
MFMFVFLCLCNRFGSGTGHGHHPSIQFRICCINLSMRLPIISERCDYKQTRSCLALFIFICNFLFLFVQEIGFYFAFLGCYTRWLLVPTLLGTIIFALQLIGSDYVQSLLPCFSFLMALWSTIYLEVWHREMTEIARRWGVYKHEEEETFRFAFTGTTTWNETTQRMEIAYPSYKRWLTRAYTIPALLLYFAACVSFMVLTINIVLFVKNVGS